MVKWCLVPGCTTGCKSDRSKRSVFRVPRDTVLYKKWEEAIPGIVKLNKAGVVCDRHFRATDISREWIKRDANGQILARAAYKYPQLNKSAVPTQFGGSSSEKENGRCADENDDTKCILNCHPVETDTSCTNLQQNSQNIANQCNVSIDRSPCIMKPPIEIISNLRDELFTEEKYSPSLTPPLLDIETVFVPMDVPSSDLFRSDIAQENPFKVPALFEISDRSLEENAISRADFCAYVPESWSFVQMRTQNVQWILFSYTITKLDKGVHCPVSQKCVTLDGNGKLNYFVYGRHVTAMKIERVLKRKEMLADILKKFKGMNVCSGLGDVNGHFLPLGRAFQDSIEKWRSKDCSLISNQNTCNSCRRSRKCVLQRAARLNNSPKHYRVHDISNPIDRSLLLGMRMKIIRITRQKSRAKQRVKQLMARMRAREAPSASTKNANMLNETFMNRENQR